MFDPMAQMKVRAAARVLGLRVDQVATYEETRLLRRLVEVGKLVDLTPPAVAPPPADVMVIDDPVRPPDPNPAEAASRAKHPAGRRRPRKSDLVADEPVRETGTGE